MYSITLGRIVVKELLQVAIQIDHDRLAAAKHDNLLWYTLGGRNVVRHLEFLIQIQQSALIKFKRIRYVKLIGHKIQLLYQCRVAGSGQSHATVFSYVEPPGTHGSLDCDT